MEEELGDIFNDIFEMLKEQFPPPEDAPSHDKRMAMINTRARYLTASRRVFYSSPSGTELMNSP
jgi:hypothetical protein